MEENRPSRDLDASNPSILQCQDYEYDEAHDALAAPLHTTPARHQVAPPPAVSLGEGGDYGYDEAHDFGKR